MALPIPCALHNCANNCPFPPPTPASRHFTPAKFGTGLAPTLPGGANIRPLCPRMLAFSAIWRPCDEKDPVRPLPTFHHRGICAVLQWRVHYQQSTADLRVAESSGARSLRAHVSGTERPRRHELLFRPRRKAGFGFPAASDGGRGGFSGRRCPRSQAAARPVEKIPLRLGKPVGSGADTLVRAISSCNLKMESPPFSGRAGRDAEKLRAPLPAKRQFRKLPTVQHRLHSDALKKRNVNLDEKFK